MFEENGRTRDIRIERDPPTPVWVREAATGKRGTDWAVPGLLHTWLGTYEWGNRAWSARVTTERDPLGRWVPEAAVRERE